MIAEATSFIDNFAGAEGLDVFNKEYLDTTTGELLILDNGFDYYNNHFKLYKNDGEVVGYVSHKFGQRPIFVDMSETKILINVLKKLLFIQKVIQKNNKFETFEEEMVCVFDFIKGNKFKSNYILLNSFDFLPELRIEKYSEYNLLEHVDLTNIIPGVIHIGQIDSFKTYEIYDDIADFEFGLTSLYTKYLIFASSKPPGAFNNAL